MTHVILAHHFGAPLPRWADEGAAILSSDEIEQERTYKLMQQILRTPGRYIPLQRLFALKDYPADAAALFAEGYSVTQFLVKGWGQRTFLEFVSQGMRSDWDSAVLEYFKYQDVGELEKNVRRSLNQGEENASTGSGLTIPTTPRVDQPPSRTGNLAWDRLGVKLEAAGAPVVVQGKQFRGVKVTAVRASSAADKQNIKPGDVLVGLLKWEMVDTDSVAAALGYCDGAGLKAVSFVLVRDGEVKNGQISLDEWRQEQKRALALEEARQGILRILQKLEEADRSTALQALEEIENKVREMKLAVQQRQAKE
jgi:hypothetical protein